MAETVTLHLPGGPSLGVELRRSARARRISLHVSRLDGRITLTLPPGAGQRLGEAFLRDRAEWLRQAVAGLRPPEPLAEGMVLPVEGVAMVLRRAEVARVQLCDGALLVPPRGRIGALTAAWLKLRARDRAAAAIARHAAALGRRAGRLRLADPRGRWGSCSAAGDIMLSWRLILAPPAVLDYVAAHEVAHLAQMNHSPAFWAEVAGLVPDWRAQRDWLRAEGAALHRFDFGSA